jgi:hypothetical protein
MRIRKTGYKNFRKINSIKKVLELNESYKNYPTIFIVTPTYWRATQRAELTRLQNTLRNVPKIVWILIEDSNKKSDLINEFLLQSELKFVHLNIKTKYKRLTQDELNKGYRYHRGSFQRNIAIKWILNNSNNLNDIVYFADDDNSYKLELFKEVS